MNRFAIMRKTLFQLTLAAFLFTLPVPYAMASGDTEAETIRQLKSLSFEQLLDIEVTSVTRKAQKMADSAAAIFVITGEDIRRTGATSIAEVLRIVPGMQVARLTGSKWAITTRGFNDRFANKLLVLMDGRTLYTPQFSGVYWDVQDTRLEDIERIEVIRGPGAALWGANAVNGVINIITKSAWDTSGTTLSTGVGSEDHFSGSIRHGRLLGTNGAVRVYAKYFDRDDQADSNGDPANDQWTMWRGGFRADWQVSTQDQLTLQGDLYTGRADQNLTLTSYLTPPFSRNQTDTVDLGGGNLLARWTRRMTKSDDLIVQLYYDRTERDEVILTEARDTVDLDLQHSFKIGERHAIVWGAGYRYTVDDTEAGQSTSFSPTSRQDHLVSAFVQDDITLVKDRLNLILGAKFEHNDYSGVEIQPNARLLWQPVRHHTFWSAVSRAVRAPSRADHDLRVSLITFQTGDGTLNQVAGLGSDDFESEELWAYEAGYRAHWSSLLSLDLALFYHDYDKLLSIEPGQPFLETTPLPPHLVIPMTTDNKMDGESYGIEIFANIKPLPGWTLSPGYSWFKLDLTPDSDSGDFVTEAVEENSPRHQVQLRSCLSLPHNLEFDLFLYYIDSIDNGAIPEYTRLDARLGWRPSANLELSLKFENLLDDHHPEYGPTAGINASEIQRSVLAKISYYF